MLFISCSRLAKSTAFSASETAKARSRFCERKAERSRKNKARNVTKKDSTPIQAIVCDIRRKSSARCRNTCNEASTSVCCQESSTSMICSFSAKSNLRILSTCRESRSSATRRISSYSITVRAIA